jgi:hypothetical protein
LRLGPAVERAKNTFGIEHVVFVGDRGMINEARMKVLKEQGSGSSARYARRKSWQAQTRDVTPIEDRHTPRKCARSRAGPPVPSR